MNAKPSHRSRGRTRKVGKQASSDARSIWATGESIQASDQLKHLHHALADCLAGSLLEIIVSAEASFLSLTRH